MNNRLKNLTMPILIGSLLVLVLFLAIQQYRWMGEVSTVELGRLRAGLRASVDRFAREFDGELTRAFLTFSLELRPNRPAPGSSLEVLTAEHFGLQWEQWSLMAPYPELIADLYWISRTDFESSAVRHFDRDQNQFQLQVWPAGWGPLTRQIEERVLGRTGRGRGGYRRPFEFLVPEIPALIIPNPPVQQSGTNFDPGPPIPDNYTVIVLDDDYIVGHWIPNLVRRYFGEDERLEYHVGIRSAQDQNLVIYVSAQPLPPDFWKSADAVGSFFRLLLNPNLDRRNRGGMFPNRRPFRRGPASNLGDAPEPAGPPLSITAGTDEGYWRLYVKHRGGSLESVVGRARVRNLSISFGVLILLTVAMGLIIYSTQRTQRMVKQQMDFVAGVTHELRTPLAVICSAGENLADGVIHTGSQVSQYGALVRDEGRRLTRMVEQILEFSGIQAQRKSLDLRRRDVNRIITQAVQELSLQIEEDGLTVDLDLTPGLPAVRVDEQAMTNCVKNLVSNAIKYGGQGRWLGIRSRLVETGDRGIVQVQVADRGLGIPQDEHTRIFEPFYRGTTTVSGTTRGSGLGLSLVQEIVAAHQGWVTLTSSPGKGSTFTVNLPADPPSE